MKLYLQKNSKGKKYWILLEGKTYGITDVSKDAHDFLLSDLERHKKQVVKGLAHYPKFIGYSIHSNLTSSSKKKTKENTLGTLVSVVYKSSDDGKLYTHTFKSKPTLIAISQKKLEIVGGKYNITDRGIIG